MHHALHLADSLFVVFVDWREGTPDDINKRIHARDVFFSILTAFS